MKIWGEIKGMYVCMVSDRGVNINIVVDWFF